MSGCTVGNIIEVAASLPAFQVGITSPPYWGVRDYEIPPVDFGDWVGQLGMEPHPDMYAAHLADILAMLPLRDDGVWWVNLGDVYISGKGKMLHKDKIKPKSKAMIPERVAFAMQERGFYYRQEVIWVKKNHMPSSWKDRQAVAIEKIMMFAKSKVYKYHHKGLTVPVAAASLNRYKYGKNESNKYNAHRLAKNALTKKLVGGEWGWGKTRPINNVWNMATANHRSAVGNHIAPMPLELPRRCILLSTDPGDLVLDPFAGTGTTAAAAAMLDRDWHMVDLDPRLPAFVAESIARACPSQKLIKDAPDNRSVAV